MAQALYTLKMFLFRKQLELTAERNTNLEKMSVFIVFIYLPYWFKTRLPLEADVSDIKFLKDLDDFKKIDDQLATKIINKFCNHLWYISKELICISFFNEDIECAEKEKMKTLYNLPYLNLLLRRAWIFSKSLEFHLSFLIEHPNQWAQNEDYTHGKNLCKRLQVVNDAAERAVALCSGFIDTTTQDAEQWQKLLLNVFENRKRIPSS
ncbi:hypothetical protein TKK_0005792 [Trichogramma kaykai]